MNPEHECPSLSVCPICGNPQRRKNDPIHYPSVDKEITDSLIEVQNILLDTTTKMAALASKIWGHYDVAFLEQATCNVCQAIKSIQQDLKRI